MNVLTERFGLEQLPSKKIEVGFDLTSTGGPFLTLDDSVKGVLDDPDWVLGGTQFFDVTDSVRQYSTSRGRSRELDKYQTGVASVVFDNRNRDFDPIYASSPYYGNIIPRRDMRITVNGIVQYTGVIDDWNLDYGLNTDSVTVGAATDGFSVLAKQTITGGTATPQTTGERINTILSSSDVQWSEVTRDIDTGVSTLGADVIADDTSVLGYLQTIETAEQGSLFIGKNGYVTFRSRADIPSTSGAVVLSDDGTGIPYTGMSVVYGSELLYNEVVVASNITGSTAVASDLDSQSAYGISNLTLLDLPLATEQQIIDMAVFLASKYSQPEYRFESVEVILDDLTESEQNQILGLELGDIVKIVFTPNQLPPAITKYAQVIRIDHTARVRDYKVTLGFQTLDFVPLVLDDAIFGTLDEGNALSF